MAWTAPRTWVTGELVTASIMNTHIRDNQLYLKTEVDRIDTLSYDEAPVRAIDTIYQNTSGKLMFVICSIVVQITTTNGTDIDGYGAGGLYIHSATPPNGHPHSQYYIRCEDMSCVGAADYFECSNVLTGWVPDNYYYEVQTSLVADGNATTIRQWTEYLFF